MNSLTLGVEKWPLPHGCRIWVAWLPQVLGPKESPTDQTWWALSSKSACSTDEKVGGRYLVIQGSGVLQTTGVVRKQEPQVLSWYRDQLPLFTRYCPSVSYESPMSQENLQSWENQDGWSSYCLATP